jgi:hypothetical protein
MTTAYPEPRPSYWRDFLVILDTVHVGEQVTSNHLRDLMGAADIPETSRGGLFSMAVRNGYLRLTRSYVPSTGTTARRSVVRVYRRTKPPAKQQKRRAA